MSSTPKNILVTGGAGFLGSHLCDFLLKDENNNIICVDNYITGDEKNIDHLLANPRFIFIRHDIIEPLEVESVPELNRFHISLHGIHEIYHLACPTSPKEQIAHPLEILLTSSHGTKNMLDIAVCWRAKFLFASASAVYGKLEEVQGITEETQGEVNQLGPRAPYEEGKRFAETLVCFTEQQHPFRPRILEEGVHFEEAEDIIAGEVALENRMRWAAVARVFSTYGPRMQLEDGRLIPDLVLASLDNKPLVVHGEESWQTSLCYIEDMIIGLVKCMQVLPDGPINLGSPYPVVVKEVAQKIIEMTGSKSKIEFKPEIPYITPTFVPDISKAKEKLDWFPVVSLDDGLKETIDDMRASQTVEEFRA